MSRPNKHQIPISCLLAGLAAMLFGAIISHQNGFTVVGSHFDLGRGADVTGALVALVGAYFVFLWIRGKLSSRV
jgi:hypothetical protein